MNFPFLEFSDGIFKLKRNHNYYYQIIGQLAISKRTKCFFFLSTGSDKFVQFVPTFKN